MMRWVLFIILLLTCNGGEVVAAVLAAMIWGLGRPVVNRTDLGC